MGKGEPPTPPRSSLAPVKSPGQLSRNPWLAPLKAAVATSHVTSYSPPAPGVVPWKDRS